MTPVAALARRWKRLTAGSVARSFSAATLATALVLVAFAGILSFAVSFAVIDASIRAELRGEATRSAQALALTLDAAVGELGQLARNSLITNSIVDSHGREVYLAPFIRDLNLAEHDDAVVELTDYLGRPIAASDEGAASHAGAAWLRDVVGQGRPHAEVRAAGEETVLFVAYPVVYGATGVPEGALAASVPLRAPPLGAGAPGREVAWRILDGLGATLAASHPEDAWADMMTAGLALPVGEPLDRLGLRVETGTPRWRALRPLFVLVLGYAAGAVLFVLAAVWTARALADRITAPLRGLSAAAGALAASGSFGVLPVEGHDETARLGAAFNEVLGRLREATEARYARQVAQTRRAEDALEEERRHAEETLRENEERLRLAVSGASLELWDLDVARGRVTLSSAGPGLALEETILTRAEWLARVEAEDRPRLEETLRAHAAGELPFFRAEFRERTAAGARWAHARGRIVSRDAAGLPTRLLGTVSDVTARKEAEEEVRRLNEGLERRVRERTAELAEANKELEAFSYSVSHDLRAPLRAIDGFTRILADDHAGALDDEGKRLCGVVRSETARMAALIDDLLAFSRLSRVRLEHGEIDMARLAQAVFAELGGGAPPAGVELRLAPLPGASGDPGLVRQVWANLLANAVKFSSKRPHPVVEVCGREADGEVVYTVRDNGAGFDMRYAEKLFGVFQRLHSEREFPGTGVGLAIVQRVVHRHGGRVWAEAAVDEGAAFHFSLPRSKTP